MTLYAEALEAMERTYTWIDYNIAKLEWLRRHRDATPAQIQEFCTRLAREMGL